MVDWFGGFGLVDWIWYVWFGKGPGPQPMMMTIMAITIMAKVH